MIKPELITIGLIAHQLLVIYDWKDSLAVVLGNVALLHKL